MTVPVGAQRARPAPHFGFGAKVWESLGSDLNGAYIRIKSPGGMSENSQGQARSTQVLHCRSRAVPGNLEPQVVASRQGRGRCRSFGQRHLRLPRPCRGAPFFYPLEPRDGAVRSQFHRFDRIDLIRPACPWLFSNVPAGTKSERNYRHGVLK